MHRHQSACDTASVSQQSSRVCGGGGSERKETNRKLSFEELEGLAARNFGAENLGEASLKGDCHDVIVHLQPQLLARL